MVFWAWSARFGTAPINMAPSHGGKVLRLAMEARARALEADERQLEMNDDVHAALGAITRAAATIPSK